MVSLARYGYSFRVLSEELRADKEVALLALRKHGHALYWASEELQADKEVRSNHYSEIVVCSRQWNCIRTALL